MDIQYVHKLLDEALEDLANGDRDSYWNELYDGKRSRLQDLVDGLKQIHDDAISDGINQGALAQEKFGDGQ